MKYTPLNAKIDTSCGQERPPRLRMGDTIVDVIDHWPGAEYGYFKCRTSNNEMIIIRQDIASGIWSWVVYRHPSAPDQTVPGAMHPTGSLQ